MHILAETAVKIWKNKEKQVSSTSTWSFSTAEPHCHSLHCVRNLFNSTTTQSSVFLSQYVNIISNFKVLKHLWDIICDVTSLMGLPPGTATQWSTESESLVWISSLILDVRTEVQCLQLWTPQMIKAVDFFTQTEPLWAPNAEPSGWLGTRHEHCS